MQYYFGIVGFVLLLMGCYLAVRRISIVLTGVRAIGEIDAYQMCEHEGSRYFSPVVSFEDDVGKTHRFTNATGFTTGFMLKNPEVGTMVAVIYPRGNPDCALIAGFWLIWAAPIGLIGLGVVGLYVSWGV